MRDLIRSPLQFVRPMTENEWSDLVLRGEQREVRRKIRRRKKQLAAPVETVSHRQLKERLKLKSLRQAADSSGVF